MLRFGMILSFAISLKPSIDFELNLSLFGIAVLEEQILQDSAFAAHSIISLLSVKLIKINERWDDENMSIKQGS